MNRQDMKELIERQIPKLARSEKDRWKYAEKLRKNFVRDFSLVNIAAMQLDEYVIGKGGNNPSFCYRLEQETRDLGLIFGNTAFKFGIFYSRDSSKSPMQYRFKKRWGKTAEEAFSSIKNEILALLNTAAKKDIQALNRNHLYSLFRGKLLFIYYPNEYFPIYSREHLQFFVTELNIHANPASSIEMQRALMEYWKSWPESKKYSPLLFMHLLYQVFPEVKKRSGSADETPDLPLLDQAIEGAKFIDQMPPTSVPKAKSSGKEEAIPKIDYITQQKQRKRIGDRGEAIVKSMEEKRLQDEGRPDLAKNIEHISDKSDKEGYDILSFDADGTPRHIEVKATSAGNLDRGFYISSNELEKSKSLPNYYIYFVFSAMSNNPRIFCVPQPNLYGSDYKLDPMAFHVRVNSFEQ